jgi:hypothetical protein
MLPGDDMVDLKRKPIVGKGNSAILASITCPGPHLPNRLLVH